MQKENRPTFQHPEVEIFYQYGMDIPEDKVKAILDLPRETLVKDMEAILQDAVDQYEYFSEKKDIPFDETCFMYHALWVLADLKAEEALPSVFNLLCQNDDVLDFWFSDYIVGDTWEDLLGIANHKLDKVATLFFEPETSWTVKVLPINIALQVALHFPERSDEVLKWYKGFLEKLLLLKDDDPVINEDAISSLVVDLCYLNAKDLLPEIKQLYERGWVFTGIPGTYEDVEEAIQEGIPQYAKRDLRGNIFEKYKDALSSWGYYRRVSKPAAREKPELNYAKPEQGTIKRTTPKVGRNEPCPCGSGKKYKKCCLNK